MREIAARMREAATKVGTTSTLWDVVFDAEAILTGEVSWADRKTVEAFAGGMGQAVGLGSGRLMASAKTMALIPLLTDQSHVRRRPEG